MRYNNSTNPLKRLILVTATILTTSSLFGADLELPHLPQPPATKTSFTLKEPIQIKGSNGNTQLLMGLDNGNMRIAIPNMPEAEAIIPLDGEGQTFNLVYPENYGAVTLNATRGDYSQALITLKPIATALAPLLKIPSERNNLHMLSEFYYKSVVLAGDINDAVDYSLQIPFENVSNDFVLLAEQLLYKCIANKKFEAATLLLSRLNASLQPDQFAEIAFAAADALRTEGEPQIGLMIYGTLADSKDATLRERSLLWAGYSSAVAGNPDQARQILSSFEEPQRGDENFVTYLLAMGRTELAEKNVRAGLRYLSRAMVLTSVEASYKPELYYLLIQAYKLSEESEAATLLLNEFEIFYPENAWLSKSKMEAAAAQENQEEANI